VVVFYDFYYLYGEFISFPCFACQVWDARTSECLHTFRPAMENAAHMEVRWEG